MGECKHEWRYWKDGNKDGCAPAVCLKCHKVSCWCSARADGIEWETFYNNQVGLEDLNTNYNKIL